MQAADQTRDSNMDHGLLYCFPRREGSQQRVSRYQDSSHTSCGSLLITSPLLSQKRVFRVASSSAARPLSFPLLRSACYCHCDSAPAPFACRNVTPHSEVDRANLVSYVPVFSRRQYSICIPVEIRLLRTDNLVDMVPAPLDFQ